MDAVDKEGTPLAVGACCDGTPLLAGPCTGRGIPLAVTACAVCVCAGSRVRDDDIPYADTGCETGIPLRVGVADEAWAIDG